MSDEGYFFNESEPTPKPAKTESLFLRMKESAEKIKASLTIERINKVLPTEDLRRTFASMKAQTMSLHNLAVLEKQQNVIEIRENDVFTEQILRDFPLIYIGAGVDIEYPLSLGSRRIVMVDPILKEPIRIQNIRQKISVLAAGDFSEDKAGFHFSFDYGQGDESVIVSVDPRAYVGINSEPIEGVERFVPPEKIGAILVFQSEDPSKDYDTVLRIVPGGVILSNRWLESFVNEYFEANRGSREAFRDATPAEKIEIVDGIYRSKGFESIRPDCFDDYSNTLVRMAVQA